MKNTLVINNTSEITLEELYIMKEEGKISKIHNTDIIGRWQIIELRLYQIYMVN